MEKIKENGNLNLKGTTDKDIDAIVNVRKFLDAYDIRYACMRQYLLEENINLMELSFYPDEVYAKIKEIETVIEDGSN